MAKKTNKNTGKKMFAALGADGIREANRLTERLNAIERLDDDAEKLRRKDTEFIKAINARFRSIKAKFANGEITKPEAQLFMEFQILFNLLERILWELKKEPGDPPKLPPPGEEPPD